MPATSPTPISDLTASLPGASGPPTRKDGPIHNKRKQTLLSLLDALHELSQDDSMGSFGKFVILRDFWEVD